MANRFKGPPSQSKGPQDAPLPLITVDEKGKFVIGSESTHLLSSIKGDIAVISVAGLYRTGKSYILNRLLGRQQGFAVGPTVNACTQGIYIWGNPVVLNRPGQPPLNVVMIDTEGLGSIQKDHSYDAKIFSLAILLSSYFIYNSMGVIDERALDALSLVVNLTKHITAKSSKNLLNNNNNNNTANHSSKATKTAASSNPNQNDTSHSSSSSSSSTTNSELAPYFPNFLWLLRDFVLDLEDERGNQISPKEYLEHALLERIVDPKNTTSSSSESKNSIRTAIKQLFKDRDCFTLVRPVSDEKQLKTIDAISYAQLRPEFRAQSDALVSKVLSEVPPKNIDGQKMNGESFVQMLSIYVDSINSGAVASIHSAWESLSAQVNQRAIEEAYGSWKRGVESKYNSKTMPVGDEILLKIHNEALEIAMKLFESQSYSGPSQATARKELKTKIIDHYNNQLVRTNREACSKLAKQLLAQLYSSLIETPMKSPQQPLTIELLVEAWNNLKKEYFSKLDESKSSKMVSLEEFLDFQSAKLTSNILFVQSQQKAAMNEKLESMRIEVSKMTKEKHEFEVSCVKAQEENKGLKSQLALEEKRVKQLESDINRLSKELSEFGSNLKQSNAELEKQKANLAKQISENDKLASTLSSTQQELDKLKDSNEKSRSEDKKSQAEQIKVKSALESQNKELTSSIQQLKTTLSASETTIKDLNRKIEELKSTTEKYRIENEASKVEQSKREKSANEASKLEKSKLESQLIESTKENQKLSNEVVKMKKLEDEAKSKQAKAEAELVKSNEKVAKLEKENIELSKNHEHLVARFKESDAMVHNLKQELEQKKMASTSSISAPNYSSTSSTKIIIDNEAPSSSDAASQPTGKKSSMAKKSTASSSSGKKSLSDYADAMDIDLPPPISSSGASRKRVRAADFDAIDSELRTPAKKVAKSVEKMTKTELKQALTASNVSLPASDKPKDFYVALYKNTIAHK